MRIVHFQRIIWNWVLSTFGESTARNIHERSLRMVEGALEVAQALELPKERVLVLVEYVYARPPGDVAQELGGAMVTLAACSAAAGIELAGAAHAELGRIHLPEVIERCRAHQEEKRRAGHTGDRIRDCKGDEPCSA